MTRVWLITGLLQYESGKTWLTIAFAKNLIERGYMVRLYKPVAGHSAWYQFKTLVDSIKYRVLVGEDVVKYRDYLGVKQDFELLNPIDILSAPPSPTRYRSIAEYLAALEVLAEQIVMVRLSDPIEGLSKYYIVEGSINKLVEGLREWIYKLKTLFNPSRIGVEDLLDEIYSPSTSTILYKTLKVLAEDSDILLVESFNDAAIPFYELLDLVEKTFMVTPGYVYELDVVGFKKLVKRNYALYGDIGVKMSKIFPYIDTIFESPLPIANSPIELASKIKEIIGELIKK